MIIKHIKLKELLSHPENKKMCENFGKRLQVQLEVSDKRFIIIHGTYINSNISNWTDTRHDHQEADTQLLCVINKLVELPELGTAGPLIFRLIFPNTDVFMLAIHLVNN